MSREHTPGPWIVLEPPHGLPEVWQFGKAECITDRVFNDNARLIAAAPDLLGTLGNLVEWLQHCGLDKTPPGGVGPFVHEGVEYSVIADARAAIAKATGEQS